MAIKIVEIHSVSPSDAAAEQSLPLVYFDMIWLQYPPAETLYFYHAKYSESCFLETIAANLKHSLSIALKHFLPLASKIIFPLTSAAMPVSRYATGDSVALTIATSDADFANLTANHPKDADEFHQFLPLMPAAVYSSDEIKLSAMAIQVTLFPNKGICIGFADHHAICDAASLFGFLRTWASIHKSNGGEQHLLQDSLPFYGRDSVQDAKKLATLVWDQVKTSGPALISPTISSPLHMVRATFILTNADIKKLKNFAMIKNPGIGRASTFVVACAHLWSCLAKSAAAAGEEVADDEPEYLTSAVDCRARLNPPLPETYFGNCLAFLRARSSHGRVNGDEGFAAAAEAIAAAVREAVGGVVDGFENVVQSDAEMKGKRVIRIAGSSRLDPCGADYGWGRAIKYECVHTDYDEAVNLCMAASATHGGVEITLSMPKLKIDAFATVFNQKSHINSNL